MVIAIAWRRLYRLIQDEWKAAEFETANAESCVKETHDSINGVSSPKPQDHDPRPGPAGIQGAHDENENTGNADTAPKAFSKGNVHFSTHSEHFPEARQGSFMILEQEALHAESSNGSRRTLSFRSSFNLLTMAAGALAKANTGIRSVLKIKHVDAHGSLQHRPILLESINVSSDFEAAEAEFEQRVDAMAKAKMGWYFRSTLHQSALIVVC
jgi:hypothetical protein